MEYKWTVLTVTTVGVLMSGIDSRILIIGLPTIAQQLHATPDEAIWITQSYLLASTVGLLLIGRVADLFGRVKIYNLGFLIFTIGSGLAVISQNPIQLIGFRILQGVGSGIVVSNSAAIITDASPRKDLGLMLGINHTALRLGTIAGLTLSGLILSVVDWRGLFYVNIPIGIFATIWAHLRLREMSRNDPSRKIDWTGFFLFSAGLSLILIAITFLSYGISDFELGLGSLFSGFVLITLFVKFESRASSPLLDLRLFSVRLFAMGNLAQLLNSLSWYGVLLLLAFYLEIGIGYTPLEAGLGILPLEVTYMIFSPIFGKLSDKFGTRVLTTLGLSINTAGIVLMSTFTASTLYSVFALSLVIISLGNGMFTAPNLSAIMGSVPATRVGIASSFRQTMFNVGVTATYGLVILFLTFGIPFGDLSILLQGSLQSNLVLKTEFFNGYRIALLLLAVIDGLAIIPSAMRGATKREVQISES